jgi:hypothetical protein
MKYNPLSKPLIAALCSLACASAFAASTFIVDSRAGGQNYANFAQSGFATSTGNVNAPGSTPNIGSMYSGTGTYFGPTRYAQFSYTPTLTGWYEVALSWPSTAGQISTAVNLYTGAATGGAADIWGNAGGPQGIIATGTMDMYYKNVGVWNLFTTAQLSSGTSYKVGLYGGYKTPYAGGVTPADASANRVAAGGARFMAATPTIGAYGGPANGAIDIPAAGAGNDLSWAAGNYDSFFDVFLDTSATPTTLVGANLPGTTLSFDPDSLSLLPSTTYYWSVTAKNVDVTTPGTIYSFTTMAIPEPSMALMGLLGGLGMLWAIRRRNV